jgi:hypothetical protein
MFHHGTSYDSLLVWVGTKVPCLLVWSMTHGFVCNPIRLFGRLLGKKNSVDIGQDTSRCDGDSSQKAVQFLIVLDGKGDVTGHDTAFLVVTCSISGKFQNLGTKVLQDSSKVDGGTSTHTGGVLSLTQVATDTTDGELQTCLGR